MFEFVRTHTRILQFILVLLIVPSFVFLGVQGYSGFNEAGNETVAKVAGRGITQAELDAAHREQAERLRRQMPNLDGKLFDSPEMKRRTLEDLVRERVMLAAADKAGFVTTDDRLLRAYLTDPQFESFRHPDGSMNKESLEIALSAQGMTPQGFEARMRQELALRQVMLGVGATALAPAVATASAFDAMFQQREIQLQRFDPKDYAARVNPTPAEIEAYYKDPANASQFQSPEQASIEYVVLDIDAVKRGISVPEEELRKYYAENAARYTTPEERRASHILIKADKSMSEVDRNKAKARAEALLAELKAKPSAFADVARKNSEDAGSAAQGGDLDFFGRGAMVKPFEEAVFALKPGELSGVVQSDFGYHIIRLTQVRGGDKRSFEAARAEIMEEVTRQLAQSRFSEAALEFSNLVYEQADSLKPVVEKLKLELRTAQGITRNPAQDVKGPLASPKLLEALFGADALQNKRNTEAVETGPSQLVSARIVSYTPASKLPLGEVSSRVHGKLVAAQAAALARKEGEARLAALRQAPGTDLAGSPVTVSRAAAPDVPQPVVEAALKLSSASLPAFTGVDMGEQGYAVVKLTKVLGRDPVASNPAQAQSQYAQAWAAAEAAAYYAALKERFKADIKPAGPARSEVQN